MKLELPSGVDVEIKVIKYIKIWLVHRQKNRDDYCLLKKGKNLPCTLIEAGPCVVTQIKTEEKDGYNAFN